MVHNTETINHQKEKLKMKNTDKTPKYKIGDTVEADWGGGHITKHVISGIKNTEYGFMYTWTDARDGLGSALHELYLTKCID